MHKLAQGFTLIEISIALVIIGLVTGGLLTGRDLIDTASLRAQVSQLEKYNTAVRTFQGKYGYLPGDIPEPHATRFGLAPRGLYAGEGDGDGVIMSIQCDAAGACTRPAGCTGETAMFWRDLSQMQLVDGSFTTATANSTTCSVSTSGIGAYYPAAKISNGNHVYTWSDAVNNYYGLSAPTFISYNGSFNSSKGLTVLQAYKIDEKIDDAMPVRGKVTACYINNGYYYYAVPTGFGSYGICGSGTWSPLAGSSTSCFDNGNVGGGRHQYSLSQNSTGYNCALSIMLQ